MLFDTTVRANCISATGHGRDILIGIPEHTCFNALAQDPFLLCSNLDTLQRRRAAPN